MSRKNLYIPKQVIMVDPEYFEVIEENPHGNRNNQPNPAMLRIQFSAIHNLYTSLGLKVLSIPRHPYLRSLIHITNTFFGSSDLAKKEIVLSNMKLDTRTHEPWEIEKWFPLENYTVHRIPKVLYKTPDQKIPLIFEGFGDLIPGEYHYFAGIGQRTTKEAIDYVSNILRLKEEKPIQMLKLVNPHFYHLDTCFCILPQHNDIIYYPGAFDAVSADFLQNIKVYQPYAVSKRLAHHLVCNSVGIADMLLLNVPFEGIQHASILKSAQGIFLSEHEKRFAEIIEREPEYELFIRYLWERGYCVIPVYTSEIRKDGAGIFCISNFVHL